MSLDFIARINFSFESWVENVKESLCQYSRHKNELEVIWEWKSLVCALPAALMMTLFCTRWFPGDIWWVLWSRPCFSGPHQRCRDQTASQEELILLWKDSRTHCSAFCLCECVCERTQLSVKVSPSVKLNSVPMGEGRESSLASVWLCMCNYVCVACKKPHMCYCTQVWVWIFMTGVMWISEKESSVCPNVKV